MRGYRVLRYAGVLLAGTAMLPALAVAQNSSIPGMGGFNLPPKPTPTPAPPPSGPIIAPLSRPTPAPAPAPTPTGSVVVPPVVTTTGAPATARPTPRPGATQPAPVATATGAPQAVATPTPVASASTAPAPAPVAVPTSSTIPVTVVPQSGWSTGTWAALGIGALALLGGAFFLFRRRKRPVEDELELTQVAPEPVAAPPPPAPKSAHLTVRLRPRTGTGISAVAEPEIEIVLIPRRAGTNLMNAAVDYRVLLRNNGKGEARDMRFGIYLFSASARQAADLQMIFASTVEHPVVAPFTLAPGQEVELAGMAQLARDSVNVMTIEGKPWFVPVMAMKAEYRWGENVGVAATATAAHMIGIDRGEGVKMSPFRFDGGPRMHPEVSQRKVA